MLQITSLMAFGVLAGAALGCARPTINEGRVLYNANGCASCHGPQGHGDGPLAKNLPAMPIDFRKVSLFKRGATEGDIAETLEEGVTMVHAEPALQQTHHVLLMPKFDHLTNRERRSIALYVMSLRDDRRDYP